MTDSGVEKQQPLATAICSRRLAAATNLYAELIAEPVAGRAHTFGDAVLLIRNRDAMSPYGPGPGGIGSKPGDMMDVQLRHQVAQGADVYLVGMEAVHQVAREHRRLATQLLLVGLRQLKNLADPGTLRHEYEPGITRIVEQQQLAQRQPPHQYTVGRQTRMQFEGVYHASLFTPPPCWPQAFAAIFQLMDYVLAVDQGTHASRAVVLSSDGQVQAQHLCPVDLARPKAGRAEQDAEQLVNSVEQSIDKALRELGARQRQAIRCCGIATQRSTVLAWRRNGVPLSAAINWQDTRGAPQLEAFRARADAIRRISGLPLTAHYGATKLHWLHQLLGSDPDVRLGPLGSYLLDRLTQAEVFAVDHCNAQRMQLFDIHALNWSPTLSDWFSVPLAKLPTCRPVCTTYGPLSGTEIPISAMSGDQNAAWFAGGEPEAETALLNLGSGAFVLAGQAADAGIPDLLSSIVYSDQAVCRYVAEGTVNGAGNALRWLEQARRISNLRSRLPAWLEQVRDPPLFMNTVGGLGSPWWREGLAPAFIEGDRDCGDAERAAGVAESILFLVQHNLERIQERAPVNRLRVSGGLSHVEPLCQKLANLSGCAVERPDEREATARGIAWLAAGRPEHWRATGEIRFFEPLPDPTLRTRYRRFTTQLEDYIDSGAHD